MSLDIDEDGNINLKVIFVGDSGVGKTNLINVTYDGTFNELETSTSNASYVVKKTEVDGQKVNLYLWDTIGQERMRAITKLFFNDSKIVVLVYDITNKYSFASLDYWLSQVKDSLDLDKIVIGICGNKNDLFEKEEVTQEQGKEFAEKINAQYALTSAKESKEGFLDFLISLIRQYLEKNDGNNIEKKISIKSNSYKKKKHFFC
jgi:small GTP-binding protein